VNANHGSDCSDLTSLNYIGLAVGGITDISDTDVHGSAFLNGGGTVNEVHELDGSCIVTDDQGTGLFDFDAVKANRISDNMGFASLSPTLAIQSVELWKDFVLLLMMITKSSLSIHVMIKFAILLLVSNPILMLSSLLKVIGMVYKVISLLINPKLLSLMCV
jgi:hypothetical protein